MAVLELPVRVATQSNAPVAVLLPVVLPKRATIRWLCSSFRSCCESVALRAVGRIMRRWC